MVHALCLRFHLLSSCLLSLFLPSLSAADVLVTLFCIFSPAACAGYPVWSNIPGGDRSKLPGKFVIFILNVSIFSPCCCGGFCCCGSSVLRNITSVTMFRHCVISAWNYSEGLNNRTSLWRNPFVQWNHIYFLQIWLTQVKSIYVMFIFFLPVMFVLGLII